MLVSYTSSSEPESDAAPTPPKSPPPKKRKLLPALPKSYRSAPPDDPSKHQGRTRSRPYVDGDYYTHVYIALELPPAFCQTLLELVDETRRLCPHITLHSFLESRGPPGGDEADDAALHVSLTHPLPLRRSQIDAFGTEVAAALRQAPDEGELRLSLVSHVKVYFNGKRFGGEGSIGRAFMALRLGAGAQRIERLVETALHPTLRKYHLPPYHDNPEYHASFAWHLLPSKGKTGEPADTNGTGAQDGDAPDVFATPPDDLSPINDAVLAHLAEVFAARLTNTQPLGGWRVTDVQLKVAKVVHRLPLGS